MDWILQPWPWYVSGPLIASVMFLLIMMGKGFGMSSNLRTLCTICGAGKQAEFFRFDWKAQKWNLIVVSGVIIGGYVGANFLSVDTAVNIDASTVSQLTALGFDSAGTAYLPTEMFATTVFSDIKGILLLIVGGFLVGFGARYAGGCTSGHAISGLSNLQLPSLIAVIGFFIGGLLMVHFLFPLIF
ncbi:MAG: YeeE/YedE thiosulfate transporter family protein [Bacteroidota bacterium]